MITNLNVTKWHVKCHEVPGVNNKKHKCLTELKELNRSVRQMRLAGTKSVETFVEDYFPWKDGADETKYLNLREKESCISKKIKGKILVGNSSGCHCIFS